jgi:ribosomal protein S18 acetylase RimI-like enzyme
MQISYRKLKSSEAKDFRQIRLECLKNFPEKMGTSFEDEAGKTKLHYESLIEQELTDQFFFGAFSDNELIGIAGFVRDQRIKTRHCGEVVAMYVKTGFQGQKVGENILREVIKTAFDLAGLEQIYLTVYDDNDSAVGLYQRTGFETCGVQKNYFKSGDKYWDRRFMQLTREKFFEE